MKLRKDYIGKNMQPPKLNEVGNKRVFGKEKDYALAFQTGKGHNDALLQRFILGKHLRKENAMYCIYDEVREVSLFVV